MTDLLGSQVAHTPRKSISDQFRGVYRVFVVEGAPWLDASQCVPYLTPNITYGQADVTMMHGVKHAL